MDQSADLATRLRRSDLPCTWDIGDSLYHRTIKQSADNERANFYVVVAALPDCDSPDDRMSGNLLNVLEMLAMTIFQSCPVHLLRRRVTNDTADRLSDDHHLNEDIPLTRNGDQEPPMPTITKPPTGSGQQNTFGVPKIRYTPSLRSALSKRDKKTRDNALNQGEVQVTYDKIKDSYMVYLPRRNVTSINPDHEVDVETTRAEHVFVDAPGPHPNVFALAVRPNDPAFLMGIKLHYDRLDGQKETVWLARPSEKAAKFANTLCDLIVDGFAT